MSLTWHGESVKKQVQRAAMRAIDKTMADCVIEAKRNHPGWRNRTGTAEGSVRILRQAKQTGRAISGLWGSSGVKYVIFLELLYGSFLRRAGDKTYPRLRGYLQQAFGGRLR